MLEKTTKNNYFGNIETVFAPATSAAEACGKGISILNRTVKGEYKSLSADNLFRLLESALSCRMPEGTNAEGFINLDPRGMLPDQPDAYLDVIVFPSYALTAIGVYAMLSYPEKMGEGLRDELKTFMDRVFFGRHVYGHSYEAADTTLQILEMFGRAGAGRFVEEQASFSKCFTETMKIAISAFREMLDGPEEDPFTIRCQEVVDIWNNPDNLQILVFVYGTLMKGQQAYDFLGSGEFLGTYLLKDHAMYDLGAFPGIVSTKGRNVVGEVFRVPSDVLKKLDKYEGEGSLYNRVSVAVSNNARTITAQAYIYNGHPYGNVIEHKWNTEATERIWYASYGSSMSRDRFNCYVYGGVLKANHKTYYGCKDRTEWEYGGVWRFPGRLYFGNRSVSWENKGVAFYDPEGSDKVIMRLYGINMGQLQDIRCQEGNSDNWYGRIYCLGIHEDGRPVYTLTSASQRPENQPSEKYTKVIEDALKEECGVSETTVRKYLNKANNKE